jgi:CrcB protein
MTAVVTGAAVAGAGALGCILRWLVTLALPPGKLPWATLAVNLAGSLVIGAVLAALASRGLSDSRLRASLVVGLLGGFTTYSSFAFEYVAYLERKQIALGAAYVAITVVGCGLACALGLVIGRRI